jgi:regulator of ribonuclease activity A
VEPIATADLCDRFGDAVAVLETSFRSYGAAAAFDGHISTVRVRDDNVLVRTALEEPGAGRVLVIDGGGSRACALLGDQLAALAARNGWTGVVVNGCVRDAHVLATAPIGVRALGTHPRKSTKTGAGERDVPVTFAGVRFDPGAWLCADTDGIVVAATRLDPIARASAPPAT